MSMHFLIAVAADEHAPETIEGAISLIPSRSRATILHVVEPLPLSKRLPASLLGQLDHMRNRAESGASAHLQRMLSIARAGRSDIGFDGRLLHGEPAAIAIAITESEDIAAVITGSRKMGHAGAWVLGSVTKRLGLEAAAPVIVVRGSVATGCERIAIGFDYSPYAASALAITKSLWPSAKREAIRVWFEPLWTAFADPIGDADSELFDEARSSEKAQLEDYLAAHQHGDVSPTISEGRIADCILARAHGQAAQLVVVGAHGASSLRQQILGSVAEKVVAHSDIPVMMINKKVADYWQNTTSQ